MKFLVTGGAGFIGSNIVEGLLKKGFQVRVIDNFSTGKKENLKEFINDIEIVDADIRYYRNVYKAMDGMDIVLHQAALPSVPRSISDPMASNESNITGTLNVLEAAKEMKVKKVVVASSSSVYGDNPVLPKREDMIINPLSPYAVTKLATEQYAMAYHRVYGLPTIALRYFNVFGPKQDPTSQYSAVIPKFIVAMLQDKQPTIYGDGLTSRDFTYIDNVVEANIMCGLNENVAGEYFNCATHGQVTLNQLVDEINKILGKNIKPIYQDFRPGDIKHSFADISKIEKLIGFKPIVMFNEGLKKTIEWYKKNL
ncbi:MAG TPA: SDR family oxidoreductase [Ignavibacteriales bacterium]|nr:SDR family oxidoreductase [Ignavibacteriales bacterium]